MIVSGSPRTVVLTRPGSCRAEGRPLTERPSSPMAVKQNTFVKHAAIYGIGLLLLRVVGFALLPLYTAYLAPADFGILELIQRTGEVILICLMVNGLRLAALTLYQ